MDLSRRHALALAAAAGVAAAPELASAAGPRRLATKAQTLARFRGRRPATWGLNGPGVIDRFAPTTSRGRDAVVLTFDACASSPAAFDAQLVATLRRHQAPATLFINRRWAERNPAVLRGLLADPLFEIATHGTAHVPLSVTGRSAYGIRGTRDLAAVHDEVVGCHDYLARTYGHRASFFRPGTAFTDEVAAEAARFIGQPVIGFTVNGDGGATFSPATVHREVLTVRPGGIVIAHLNHPEGGTAEGFATAIPALRARGLRLRRLRDVLPTTPAVRHVR